MQEGTCQVLDIPERGGNQDTYSAWGSVAIGNVEGKGFRMKELEFFRLLFKVTTLGTLNSSLNCT